MKDTTPLLENIVDSPSGIDTLNKLWKDAVLYIHLLSAFQARGPTSPLMGKYMTKITLWNPESISNNDAV